MNDRAGWTVAYRHADEPVFHRVALNLSWGEASVRAGEFRDALPADCEVWFTTTRAAELTNRVPREDVLNILVDEGVRVPIADDGVPLEALRLPRRSRPVRADRR